MMQKQETVELYTDGACRGNPGPGGWGALLRYKGREQELFGGEQMTTNNRMELMAVIQGLNALKRRCEVHVTTDSVYVKNGISLWIKNWKKNQWKTASKKPVKNIDLWQLLDRAVAEHQVDWSWVKGHSGHTENERADMLANRGIDTLLEEQG